MSRNNSALTLLASAARTASTTSGDVSNPNGKAAQVILNVTAKSDSPSITLTIQGKDEASGQYYTLLTGSAVTDVTSTPSVYSVGLGVASVANVSAGVPLPTTWRVSVAHSDADSITYSVGAHVIG